MLQTRARTLDGTLRQKVRKLASWYESYPSTEAGRIVAPRFEMVSHTGRDRITDTLSGGETFIAALALALGLADVVEGASGKVRLETIFIDEGFGSLDTDGTSGTLDQVLNVLQELASQSRAVGLISHVPQVQEAIPNGFQIIKTNVGSRIETRGLV
jgi:DNA repair protein SbcC/Rad50